MQRREYWARWYSEPRDTSPSGFALFCEQWFDLKDMGILSIADVGSGNGRDSAHFRSLGHGVDEIDWSVGSRDALREDYSGYDLVYARWFLHAIPPSEREIFIRRACKAGVLMTESRSSLDDEPPAIVGHPRWPVSEEELRTALGECGHRLEFLSVSRGWSRVRYDDPMLIRAISRRT